MARPIAACQSLDLSVDCEHVFKRGVRKIESEDEHALGRQQPRGSKANSPCRAGDQGDLSLQ
jgi:hypothetical protein